MLEYSEGKFLKQKPVGKDTCNRHGKRLGKVIGVPTHVEYIVRIDGKGEGEENLENEDYSLGNFVAISPICSKVIVGVISDTILVDSEYSRYGLQLSDRDEILKFAPDYLEEKSTMVKIIALGFFELENKTGKGRVKETEKDTIMEEKKDRGEEKREERELKEIYEEIMERNPSHEVCPVCPEIGSSVYLLGEKEIKRFHTQVKDDREEMMMGYLGLLISRKDILSQSLAKLLLKKLIVLFPENRGVFEMLCKNIEHKMKIEGAHAR